MLVTMDAERRVLPAGALAIDDGAIADVGSAEALADRWEPGRLVDASGLLVTPGLINAHVHLTGPSLLPGLEPASSPVPEHFPRWVLPAHEHSGPEEERAGARLMALMMLRAGTTAFIEAGVVRHPAAVLDALRPLGIRGSLGVWAADLWGSAPDLAAALSIDSEGDRVEIWPNLIGHSGCSDEQYTRARRLARRRFTFHMSAFPDDREWFDDEHGAEPLVHLERLGALDGRAVVAHAIHLTDAEVEALTRSGATVAFCPGAAVRLATGASTAGRHPELPHVALGTDTPNASNHVDLLRAAATACELYGEGRGNRCTLTPEHALDWLFAGGARALGRDDLGSLEPGKRADISCFQAGQPVWNAANALVFGSPRAVHAFVDGEPVLQDGRVPGEEQILADAEEAGRRLAARAGLPQWTGWPLAAPATPRS